MQSTKANDQPTPALLRFITAWLVGWFLASWLADTLLSSSQGYGFQPRYLLYFSLLSVFQLFVIYTCLRVELRRWIHLAVFGAITGLIGYHLMFDGGLLVYPTKAANISLYLVLWSTPAIFQWLALRGRFHSHALWLLAAVIIAPLTVFLDSPANSGIFVQALPLFTRIVSSPDAVDFFYGALRTADSAIPAVTMGLVLYVVIVHGGKSDSADRDAS